MRYTITMAKQPVPFCELTPNPRVHVARPRNEPWRKRDNVATFALRTAHDLISSGQVQLVQMANVQDEHDELAMKIAGVVDLEVLNSFVPTGSLLPLGPGWATRAVEKIVKTNNYFTSEIRYWVREMFMVGIRDKVVDILCLFELTRYVMHQNHKVQPDKMLDTVQDKLRKKGGNQFAPSLADIKTYVSTLSSKQKEFVKNNIQFDVDDPDAFHGTRGRTSAFPSQYQQEALEAAVALLEEASPHHRNVKVAQCVNRAVEVLKDRHLDFCEVVPDLEKMKRSMTSWLSKKITEAKLNINKKINERVVVVSVRCLTLTSRAKQLHVRLCCRSTSGVFRTSSYLRI